MGGKGSGGERSGSPNRAYSNRTDLNTKRLPVQTGRGQPYGTATAQAVAQRAVPLASPQAPRMAPPEAQAAGASPLQPRAAVPLNAPTARPDEPVTSGLPIGAGAGPESVFLPPDPTLLELRALYALFPNNDLLGLIEELEMGRTV